MNKFYPYSLIALALALATPIYAHADPKTDVTAYEAAFDKGDEVNGAKLLKDALNNASSLPAGNAYLAKIGYDNALYFSQVNNYTTAFNAIEFTKKAFDSNPTLANNADIDSFNLLYSWLKYRSDSENKNAEKYIKALDINARKLDGKPLGDNILLRANTDLLDYYMFKLKLSEATEVLARQERTINNTSDISIDDKKIVETDIALRRGQLQFLKAASKFTTDHSYTKIDRNAGIDWVTPYKEILKARILYGKPESFEDATAANIEGWIGLVEAFATSFFESKKVEIKLAKAQKDVGYNYEELLPANYKKECLGIFAISDNFVSRDRLSDQFFFGTATILYDVTADLKPTNLRVVNSYPNVEFAKNVAENLWASKVKATEENVPAYCYKDNVFKVNFYVNNSFPE